MKRWWQSGTFWGALATGLTGVGKVVVAVSSGDQAGLVEGIGVIFGAFTAWRLRKGQSVPIDTDE